MRKIFHRGVEVLFDDRTHAVNFIDKEHIVLVEVGEQAGQISGFVEYRPRRWF